MEMLGKIRRLYLRGNQMLAYEQVMRNKGAVARPWERKSGL